MKYAPEVTSDFRGVLAGGWGEGNVPMERVGLHLTLPHSSQYILENQQGIGVVIPVVHL